MNSNLVDNFKIEESENKKNYYFQEPTRSFPYKRINLKTLKLGSNPAIPLTAFLPPRYTRYKLP